ncbi:MAG: hypothetical protein ACFB3T_03665 [Geminicoccaceae bacterium]
MTTLRELTPLAQTRISAAAMAAHAANLRALLNLTWLRLEEPWGGVFQQQYFRAYELIAAISRPTEWVVDPWSVQLSARFEGTLSRERLDMFSSGPGGYRQAVWLDALALGHAVHSTVRLTPLLPPGTDMLSPYPAAAQYLDLQSGQLIQAHIRCLKGDVLELPEAYIDVVLESRRACVNALWRDMRTSLIET